VLPDEAFHKMYDQFERTSKEDGIAKLARHWGRLGFKRLRDGEFFFLNMREDRPTLEDLIEDE
jgi:hypothetical protein